MKVILFISLVMMSLAAKSQVFPVRVDLQIAPPYSPYLADYTMSGSQNFAVNVRLNDVAVLDYACRLRITIEGVGITLRTKANYPSHPLLLQGGGIPEVFYGPGLSEYFHPLAFEVSGMPSKEPEKTGRLPEGIYRFTVEVLDYYRGTVVSNMALATVWIVLNDPPMLNMPLNFSKISFHDPLSILFSWTPRHTASPNSAFTAEYIFRLIELWPANRNPYDAFLTQQPLFETVTNSPQLLYGPAAPALLPGRTYAWQVEVREPDGKDLFKNKGFSEVFVFQYADVLAVPPDLRMRWAKPTTLAIEWDAVDTDLDDIRYRLKYRPRKRQENHRWYETWTRFTEKTLYDLVSNTEYEMQIRAETGEQESEYSAIRVFKTLRDENVVFACSDDVLPPPVPANTLPVFPLAVNDTIRAGGYDVIVRDVAKVGSRYHGSGVAIIPWFNGAKVRVTFESIGVNDHYWLTSGIIKSVWSSDSHSLFQHQTPMAPGREPSVGELDITVVTTDSMVTIEGAAIASVTRDENDDIVITTTDGRTQTLPGGAALAIADEVGNGYLVDDKGNITKTTTKEATAATGRSGRIYDIKLRFAKGTGVFGFDEKRFEELSQYYQQLDNGSYVAWKALSSSGMDVIHCIADSGTVDGDRIRFERGGTAMAPAPVERGIVSLNLQGNAAGVEEELLALHSVADSLPPTVLGKVNLVTYNRMRYNLEIVTVNGARLPGALDADAVSRSLNGVYSQAVVEWDVRFAPDLQVSLPDVFDTGESDVFSNYTRDMKTVLKAFGRLRENTFYLFVIDAVRNNATLGYMPRNRPAGFIFAGPHQGNSATFLKTIAHELGHGAFNLKHTFSEHNIPEGLTDNVMDYSEGTALYKYQWDYIHEPRTGITLFDVTEDGSSLDRGLTEFFDDAAPLLESADYKHWVEKVREVCAFYKTCANEEWESYGGKGIVPYCFWRDENVSPPRYYSNDDLPFTAGLIDGGYNEAEGIYHLPPLLREMGKMPGKVLYAYTLAYWQCSTDKVIAGVEDYEYVVDRLAVMEQEGGLWNWVKEQWYDYKGEKEDLESYLEDCREVQDLREAIDDLYELSTNWEDVKLLSAELFHRLTLYWHGLGRTDNAGRYERGALIVPTASLVLPLGVGLGSKAEKFKATLHALRETTTGNIETIAARITEGLLAVGNRAKLDYVLGKIYDDCIKAGYVATDEGADIVFRTENHDAVAKISDRVLRIKIPAHHNGWAPQSASAEAMAVLEKVNRGSPVYKVGTAEVSTAAEAQYWSLENPLDYPDIKVFAHRYGIPEANLASGKIFVQIGKVKANVPRITREAPSFQDNPGGYIEIVVPVGGVEFETFHTIQFK